MPRPKKANPAYRSHVCGQAAVRLDGKDFYLGPYDSPESYARYYALLAEYNANGRKAPETDSPIGETERLADTAILVKHVTADYRHEELPRLKHSPGHYTRQDKLLQLIDERYGEIEADSFGPRKLQDLRRVFIDRDNSRRYINEQVQTIVRIFRHGVARELVSASTITALECVKPLRKGEAKDNPKRRPVPLEDVQATLPELQPVVVAMVRIQLATTCRPSEVFNMRPCDIDRSGDVWFYRPAKHKTADHGITKAVPLNDEAVDALSPYLFGPADELCFKTSIGTPWDKDSYRHAIRRAARRSKVKHWSPYQLRHLALQTVRDAAGPEAAQAIAGHSRMDTTEIYAKASELKAVEAARVTPRLAKSC